MTTLRVLTGINCRGLSCGCNCPACAADLTRIADQRLLCEACHGDSKRCQQGQGEYRDFAALTGCLAFTDTGTIATPAPKRAKRVPQPWDARPARAA